MRLSAFIKRSAEPALEGRLEANRWNVIATAADIGCDRSTLYRTLELDYPLLYKRVRRERSSVRVEHRVRRKKMAHNTDRSVRGGYEW